MTWNGTLAIRRRRLEPFSQRARRALARLSGGAVKTQRVYRVDIGDVVLKQIVMPHRSAAAEVASVLRRLRDARVAPRLMAHLGNELWLEYLEGDLLHAGDPPPMDELARIFATLYRDEPRRVGRDERDFGREIEGDLDFLRGAGVLDARLDASLRDRARAWSPDAIWVGCDYSDARPANFLRTPDGELRVIDVESLRDDHLLGAGAVRAGLRWPGLAGDDLIARLVSLEAAPFHADLDFVELWFLASWTKRCVLLRKRRLVDPGLFARIAERD
jgi:hypothetical protein